MRRVDGKAVIAAREKKDWTQLDLSDATKINVSTLSRIERGKSAEIRPNTLKKLCVALSVQPSDLCPDREPERDFMKVRIGAAARNALALVARRYRVPRECILEIAPLLFLVAAEQSLTDRRRRLQDLREAADGVERAAIHHLPFSAPVDEELLSLEEKSINGRDLFGAELEEYPYGYRDPDGDGFSDNPFARFLNRTLDAATSGGAGSNAVRWGAGLWPSYQICQEEALSVVGGDAEAARAIVTGAAAIHEMPKKPATAATRADWAKIQLARQIAEFDDLLGSIDLAREPASSEGAEK